jgi:hypothetical protein
VVYDASADPVAVTYAWTESSGGADVTLSDPTGETTNVVANPDLTATTAVTVTVEVTNPDGTTVEASDTVTVEVTAPPPPPVTTPGDATSVSISFGNPF